MPKVAARHIWYSFPLQLLLLHCRKHLWLTGMWIWLTLLLTGAVGRKYGVRFLFLSPEYLGQVNWLSFLLTGGALGWFIMTWQLTSYLIHAYRYPFLATMSRPFTKFCINNMVLAAAFTVHYLILTAYFQWHDEFLSYASIIVNCTSLLVGMGLSFLLHALFFQFANTDIDLYLRKHPEWANKIGPTIDTNDLEHLKEAQYQNRIDIYLDAKIRPRRVRSAKHYPIELIAKIFRQNHINSLIWLGMGILVLIGSGFLIEYPIFQLPSVASIFILSGVTITIYGVITWWTPRWRGLVGIVLFGSLVYLSSYTSKVGNEIYGLNYDTPPTEYNYAKLTDIIRSTPATNEVTTAFTNRLHQCPKSPSGQKPKMVIVCASGGGLRAAIWATKVLADADLATNGKLWPQTTLMTGASGGMIGLAYIREVYRQSGAAACSNQIHVYNMGADILNSVGFTILTNDIFLPMSPFEYAGKRYYKDRGYIWEQQFNRNTGNILQKTIGSYRKPELTGQVPMLVFTPTIVNDNRQLLMSPLDVRTAMRPIQRLSNSHLDYLPEIDAVDYRALFPTQAADSVSLVTALRLNATFPYILPNAELPTEPRIELMDAGFRDNYGILTASRFIHSNLDWIKENTSGVVILQITGWEKIETIEPSTTGIAGTLLTPIGATMRSVTLQDFEQDASLRYLSELLGTGRLDVVRFTYLPTGKERASIAWHLTRREKGDVIQAINHPENQQALQQLKQLLD